MPTLLRWFLIIGVICCGLIVTAVLLANFVEPARREIVVTIPPQRLAHARTPASKSNLDALQLTQPDRLAAAVRALRFGR